MSKTVIKVENISKQYRLGLVGTGSLAHDLNRSWHKIRGKEDPYLKIGDINDRTVKGRSEYVWALKDINFEVKQGEVLGIIGRNGAGKSTLLKILSRTTTPTTGSIKIKGRVASLLEVGTGFHPELSGRENIFLNGAILGMTRNEIKKKFDEIVDFSGVERYIDTPVKRYSSGMYVRLAFAVAAHLEPEILIVDEVLAVGDAEFQKKALGKMKEVSIGEGRTILFVSHNIVALQKICNKGILLINGSVAQQGWIDEVANNYLALNTDMKTMFIGEGLNYNQDKIRIIKALIDLKDNNDKPLISDSLEVIIQFKVLKKVNLNLTLVVYTQNEEHLLSSPSINNDGSLYSLDTGLHEIKCKIPPDFFNTGVYFFSILFVEEYSKLLLNADKVLSIEFKENLIKRGQYLGNWGGSVRPNWNWDLNKF